VWGGVWAPGPPPQWRGSKGGLRPPLAGSRGGAPAEKCNIRVSNGKISSDKSIFFFAIKRNVKQTNNFSFVLIIKLPHKASAKIRRAWLPSFSLSFSLPSFLFSSPPPSPPPSLKSSTYPAPRPQTTPSSTSPPRHRNESFLIHPQRHSVHPPWP